MNDKFLVGDCAALTARLHEQCCRLADDPMSKQLTVLGAHGMSHSEIDPDYPIKIASDSLRRSEEFEEDTKGLRQCRSRSAKLGSEIDFI